MHFVFCISVMVFAHIMISTRNRSVSRNALKRYIVMAVVCLIGDMFSYIFDMKDFAGGRFLNHLSMIVAIFTTVLLGYFCNRLFDAIFDIREKSRLKNFLFRLPIYLAGVMLVVNIFTGFVFEISEENVYSRGDFYFISAILQYFYFAAVSVRALLGIRSKKTLKRHRLYRAMVLVGCFSLAFGAAQIIASGKIALHCFGVTLGVLTIFTCYLNDQITQDRLTGLNNRYALDNYMHIKMDEYSQDALREKKLYLVMMDMDGFKGVNDEYGHMAGDDALKQVSLALKKVAEGRVDPMFIARFGGDEFSVIYEAWNEEAVIELCRDIKAKVSEQFIDDKYKLSISAGYAVFKSGMNIDAWYSASDAALYKDKTESRKLNNK